MTNPLNPLSIFQEDFTLPGPPVESDSEHQQMLKSQLQEYLSELRRREAGFEAEQHLWFCIPDSGPGTDIDVVVSSEFERLLLEYGCIGEIYGYISCVKKSLWAEAEGIFLEHASAGMLISLLGDLKYPWLEALLAIEARFDPEDVGDVAPLALYPEVLPNDLRVRLCTRVENEGISTRATWNHLTSV